MSWRRLLLFPTVVLMMACSEVPLPVGPAADIDGDWVLVAWTEQTGPVAMPAGTFVTLRIEPTTISGSLGCNSFGAERLPGRGFALGMFHSTLIGCEPDVARLEAAYSTALGRIRDARTLAGRLVLVGDGLELVFDRAEPPPLDALLDRSWRLVELVRGGVASPPAGAPAGFTARADGSFSGSTGCRELTGRFTVVGGELLMVELRADGPVCPRELEAQDGHVVSVIGDGFRAVIGDDGRLTIFDSPDEALVYEPDPGIG